MTLRTLLSSVTSVLTLSKPPEQPTRTATNSRRSHKHDDDARRQLSVRDTLQAPQNHPPEACRRRRRCAYGRGLTISRCWHSTACALVAGRSQQRRRVCPKPKRDTAQPEAPTRPPQGQRAQNRRPPDGSGFHRRTAARPVYRALCCADRAGCGSRRQADKPAWLKRTTVNTAGPYHPISRRRSQPSRQTCNTPLPLPPRRLRMRRPPRKPPPTSNTASGSLPAAANSKKSISAPRPPPASSRRGSASKPVSLSCPPPERAETGTAMRGASRGAERRTKTRNAIRWSKLCSARQNLITLTRLLRPSPPFQTPHMPMPTMRSSSSSGQSTLNPSRRGTSGMQRESPRRLRPRARRPRFQGPKWVGARVRGRGCTSCSRRSWRRRK